VDFEITQDGEKLMVNRLAGFYLPTLTCHIFTDVNEEREHNDTAPIVTDFDEASWVEYAPVFVFAWSPGPSHDPTLHATASPAIPVTFQGSALGPVFPKGIYLTSSLPSKVNGWGYFKADKSAVEIPQGGSFSPLLTLCLKTTFFVTIE